MPKHALTETELQTLRQLVKEADEAVHRSMPVGGNAHHELAQARLNELRRALEELAK